MSQVHLDITPSNASTCNVCKQRIGKGEIRIYARARQFSHNIHWACAVKEAAKLEAEIIRQRDMGILQTKGGK